MKKAFKQLKIEELKKEKSFLGKICVFFLISVLSYATFYGYSYYLDQKSSNDRILHIKQNIAKNKVEKFDNVETKIFDLNDENKEIIVTELEDISGYEVKENINSDRISSLENEVAELKLKVEQVSKISGQSALIISYVHLRQKIFSHYNNDFSYYEELKNFDILSDGDEFLKLRINHLKSILRSRVTHESLVERFDYVADKFVSYKEFEGDSDFLNKIKTNLLKIIVIRKVGETDHNTLDGKVALIIRSLKNQDYIRANRILLGMENKYRIIAGGYLMDLNHMIALKRVDNEILNYLSNNIQKND